MIENNDIAIKDAVNGAGAKIIGFGIITAVWLCVAFYLGWNAHNTLSKDVCAGTYTCLSANEWGDFLAGVFAPVAFFWLLAAVWIQSDELRAQRTELQITRSVMQAQADEAKKQAQFIGTQTEYIKQAQFDDQFKMKLKTLRQLVASRFGHRSKNHRMNGEWDGNWNEYGYLNRDLPDDMESAFLEITARISNAVLSKIAQNNDQLWKQMLDGSGKQNAWALLAQLKSIAEDRESLGPAMQTLVRTSHVEILIEELEPLVKEIEEQLYE